MSFFKKSRSGGSMTSATKGKGMKSKLKEIAYKGMLGIPDINGTKPITQKVKQGRMGSKMK